MGNNSASIPLFVTCLCALPNLHSIKILHATEKLMRPFRDTFSKQTAISLPSVREMSISEPCHGLVFALPEVRVVWDTSTAVLTSLMKRDVANKVEVLRDTGGISEAMFKRFINRAPSLRVIEVPINGYSTGYIPSLKKAGKHLHTIELRLYRSYDNPMSEPTVQSAIKACRSILKASPSREKKYLKVVTVGPSVQMPNVDEGERVSVAFPVLTGCRTNHIAYVWIPVTGSGVSVVEATNALTLSRRLKAYQAELR
ncbi:hypothetical protein NMY22_g9003 [Coprinellus aureogranulatus]|nr:hypothetical protein NMY22_g9003 [Coprinellus aureogranulatus]